MVIYVWLYGLTFSGFYGSQPFLHLVVLNVYDTYVGETFNHVGEISR